MNLFSKAKQRVQFKHYPEDKKTIAFVAPTVKELLKAASNLQQGKDTLVKFKYGVAKVHPNDQYEKKIGREVSENKLEEQRGTLDNFVQYNGFAHYRFSTKDQSFTVLLTYGKEIPFLVCTYLNVDLDW